MIPTGADSSASPQSSDSAKINGVESSIVQVGTIYSGEQVAAWRLHLLK